MTNERVEVQNRRLADLFGRSPVETGSQPIYAWKWAPSLTHRVRSGEPLQTAAGLTIVCNDPVYIDEPEIPEAGGRWVLAQWIPSGSEASWRDRYGVDLAYPRHGEYWSNSKLWCRVGEEPDDECTNFCIRVIKANLDGSMSRENRESRERREVEVKNNLSDQIDDAWVKSVPGLRGGPVSYPAIRTADSAEKVTQ